MTMGKPATPKPIVMGPGLPPPLPTMPVRSHSPMARGGDDLENGLGARVLLLEQQAPQNHLYVGRLAMTIESLTTGL